MATNPYTAIHINTSPTTGTAAAVSDVQAPNDTVKEAPKTGASAETSTSPLHTAQTLVAPATILPPEVLTYKAKSSKTVGNADKPIITKVGPKAVGDDDSDTSSSSDDDSDSSDDEKDQMQKGKKGKGEDDKKTKKKGNYAHLMPKIGKKKDTKKIPPMPPTSRNGYVKKGYELDGARESEDEDKDEAKGKEEKAMAGPKKPEVCHVHEMTMSETVEELEGGGRRTAWVRTDRNITVLIEDAKTLKEKEREEKARVLKNAFGGMKIGKAISKS